jgi:dihydropteroate synthase
MEISRITGQDRTAVMGILNITPDSFSDGGQYFSMDKALYRAESMVAEGAAILDIGGESTRPGSDSVGVREEIDRVIPVIEAVIKNMDVYVSCDTSKPEVASSAVKAGACMINDVAGFNDPGMRQAAAAAAAAVCIMHMSGTPRTMQSAPEYDDAAAEIKEFLHSRAALCEEDGIPAGNIIIDPGIGFGKTLEHNLRLLASIELLGAGRYPVMIGASRKSFLGMLLDIPVDERMPASIGIAGWCAVKGARIVRVHDVKETKQVLDIVAAVSNYE